LAASGLLLTHAAIAGMQEIKDANNQLGLEATSLNVDYAETDNYGTLLDTEKGSVPGQSIYLSSMSHNGKLYFHAQYSRNEGKTDYVGGLIGPPATAYGSVVTTSGATLTNYSLRLGKGFELGSPDTLGRAHMLTPFLELDRQIWYRGVNAGETYYHNAYAAGLLWQTSASGSKLVFSAYGLAGQTFNASINVSGSFSGALGSSPLYKAGINIDYAPNKILHLHAGADYVRFAYGQSDVYSGYLEPDSTSTYVIYKAGVGIAF
jgi:hypothetical protein